MGNYIWGTNEKSLNKGEELKEQILQKYYQKFTVDRNKIRYLHLRRVITMLALEQCVEDYNKEGLNQKEIQCIKDKTFTFLKYFNEFFDKHSENFSGLEKTKKINEMI